jgi:hypothetical protein
MMICDIFLLPDSALMPEGSFTTHRLLWLYNLGVRVLNSLTSQGA